ncbi:hypothetical protein [Fodinicola feengrottensis]|uniref:hypothetical protein n=1 Tax=Fodinicola feengrottensis TaxID=435914 RepID=UPI0024421463|nr:hypothetical protein [Fodinicola feengrottensis]
MPGGNAAPDPAPEKTNGGGPPPGAKIVDIEPPPDPYDEPYPDDEGSTGLTAPGERVDVMSSAIQAIQVLGATEIKET